MSSLVSTFRNLTTEERRHFFLLFLTDFLILFSYPFFRASTTTLFLESYGAKSSPQAWFAAILVIAIVIGVINFSQKKWGIHRIYSGLTMFSVLIFFGLYGAYEKGQNEVAFMLFVWKEAYIVLVFHLLIGYCNNFFSAEQAKVFYGPLTGIGSLASMLGGFATAGVSETLGVTGVIVVGSALLVLSIPSFWPTPRLGLKKQIENKITPLKSIQGVGPYVFCIAAIVILSQFILTITELKFNVLFEQIIPISADRTAYLGYMYSAINGFALVLQFIIFPLVLSKVSNRVLHYCIPGLYLLLAILGLGVGAQYLMFAAIVFIVFKGTDYSVFAVAKEFLYQNLSYWQRYGAKYIADMFCYRSGKAFSSLLLIYFQSELMLSVFLYSCLALWFVTLYFLFKFQRQEPRLNSQASL
ncbi:MAG: hypothetical protein JNM93_12540 [Bacteriovoracaceae bacterium]|nr:hypothetical protein [Bacteriovoracaceae bacterium]